MKKTKRTPRVFVALRDERVIRPFKNFRLPLRYMEPYEPGSDTLLTARVRNRLKEDFPFSYPQSMIYQKDHFVGV